MKAKKCMLALYTKHGNCCVKQHFESIAKAVRFSKESGCFSYKVFVDGEINRQGLC